MRHNTISIINMKKEKILIIIPNGGTSVPEELAPHSIVSDFELFMFSDPLANQLFAFQKAAGVVDSLISPLFIDLNEHFSKMPPSYTSGVIKTETPNGKQIFEEGVSPDSIASANILRRYYFPFHDAVKRSIMSEEINLIIECRVNPAVGFRNSSDSGVPMPLVRMKYVANNRGKIYETAPKILCDFILSGLRESFKSEPCAAEFPFEISEREMRGEIALNNSSRIPFISLEICSSLFLNDNHFNPDYMKADQIRLKKLNEKLWNSIEKGSRRFGII